MPPMIVFAGGIFTNPIFGLRVGVNHALIARSESELCTVFVELLWVYTIILSVILLAHDKEESVQLLVRTF